MEEELLEKVAQNLEYDAYPFPEGQKVYYRHLLEKTHEYELYCIVWNEGATTPFHGHPVGGCWMRVVEGELVETTVLGDRILRASDSGFQKGPSGIHRIVARQPSRSLHLYKPEALR